MLGTSNIGENIAQALGSMNLWNAVVRSVAIILIGYIFTKKGILPKETKSTFTKFVMTVALPCLAFSSFMTSITVETFRSAVVSFIYGFVVYVAFIFLSKLIFAWVKDKDKRIVMEILFTFGSTTFFGQPLIRAVFPGAFNDSSMFNVAYRVFLYSYAYYAICVGDDSSKGKVSVGDILKRIFVNPIIIATFAGFILWSLQLLAGDATDPSNWWVVTVNGATGAFWNIQVSLPPVYSTMSTLGGLSSPMVWIAIGCTLGQVSFKEAVADRDVWIYAFVKIICAPLLNFLFLYLIKMLGVNVTFNTVAATTLMWAVPPATVAVTYCINSNKQSTFASSCSLITTLVAVVFIPVYMILLTIIQSAGIFA